MKTFIFLFSLNFIFLGAAVAQVAGEYSFEDPKERDVSYYFDLYENGTFEISINESLTDDMGLEILLSYGSYTLNNGNIELHDNYNGINMQFEYNPFYFIAKKSFSGFVGKKFIKVRSSQEMENPLSEEIKGKIKTLKQIVSTLNASNLKANMLNSGIYEGEFEKFNLYLSDDNTYEFKYHSFVISKGEWSRNKNKLLLYDSILKLPLYFFIDINGVYNLITPGFDPHTSLLKKM